MNKTSLKLLTPKLKKEFLFSPLGSSFINYLKNEFEKHLIINAKGKS